jgi:hypothetical protein
MNDLIYKLKNSTPSLSSTESYDLFLGALSSEEFVICDSDILGFDNALGLSQYFIDALAVITMHDGNIIPAIQPLHVLYFNNPDNLEYVSWGLLYQNGIVLYSESKLDPEKQHLIVFLSKEMKDELQLETQVWNIKSDPK